MKSRCWRYGDLWRATLVGLALALLTAPTLAMCPPDAADGVAISKGELVLAYRLVASTGTPAHLIPMAKHFSLDVRLCTGTGAAMPRLQKVDATMPEHRHGMNYRPTIMPLDSGRYRIEGMMFHMAGHWELAFEVQLGNQVTRITHDVQID